MFKKYTNRQLLLTLAALLLVYVVSLAFGGSSNTSFRKNLAQVDTAQVSEIIISLPENQGDVTLNRDPAGWQVTRPDGKSFPAASSNVNSMLRETQKHTGGSVGRWEKSQLGGLSTGRRRGGSGTGKRRNPGSQCRFICGSIGICPNKHDDLCASGR